MLDVTDRIKASETAGLDHFLQPMQDAMAYQGRLWGTAQDFNGTVIYLNLSTFQNAGPGCAVRKIGRWMSSARRRRGWSIGITAFSAPATSSTPPARTTSP